MAKNRLDVFALQTYTSKAFEVEHDFKFFKSLSSPKVALKTNHNTCI